ncbi:unnamed protein product [Rhizophagus irregularis]|uniref:Uncharacterized protein n=3 Tax=Rhizophagus irregularis TaxID=588596 RepID=A0A916EAA9_9GLOM|nr:unnamed protein product [Rhizophagus irregularis]CAB5372653.1 unnamed protein product [Rhizophagus irregularis]
MAEFDGEIDQSHPTSLNDSSTNNPVKIDVFYRLKRHLSQQPVERVVIGIMCTFVLIAAIFYAIPSKPSSFFQNFADTTNDIFKKIDNVDLPAASSIMKHTVACRRAANMIQGSPAFKSHGSQIAKGLRKFGEKIMEAGHLLQKMYSKGSSVYKSFDMEIEAMMNRLNSNYIRRVQQTHTSIHNAENIRHDTEGYIFDGLREAENFIANNNHCHMMEKILRDYEDKLMDIPAELDKVGGTYDFFEVTKSDLRYLKYAVENSKSSLYKFHKKALVSN